MENVKHIVQFSGGKDSTCMLLMMLEKGMPVDEITFCDTGMEFPQMYEHIDKVEQYIGRKITRLKAENSFEFMLTEYQRVKGDFLNVKGYGWASMKIRWCTSYFKVNTLRKYLGKTKDVVKYIGIAADEPKRHMNIPANVKHPLFDWGVTEKMALQTCYNHGFTWGGLYEDFHRVSCWCCPLKSLNELRILYHKYPALWERLKDLDNRCWNQFRVDYSVMQLEEKFKQEDYIKKISIPLFNDQVS